MKTYSEFGKALLNGESVYVTNGKGLVISFYPCLTIGSDVITVCVEFRVRLADDDWHTSSSVVTELEAYNTYKSLASMA